MDPQTEKLKAAKSLKEWCAALGEPVPDMEARAVAYEAFGMGPRSTYSGTAEQNNRLLTELKRGMGLL